jgi:hypothetical protein
MQQQQHSKNDLLCCHGKTVTRTRYQILRYSSIAYLVFYEARCTIYAQVSQEIFLFIFS